MYESSKRDPAVSRIPPQTSPVDRSRSGDAAFGVRPGVQAATLFADPSTPFGGNGNGCHGPLKIGSLTIPGNCPTIL
jgi:hypothetical protein